MYLTISWMTVHSGQLRLVQVNELFFSPELCAFVAFIAISCLTNSWIFNFTFRVRSIDRQTYSDIRIRKRFVTNPFLSWILNHLNFIQIAIIYFKQFCKHCTIQWKAKQVISRVYSIYSYSEIQWIEHALLCDIDQPFISFFKMETQ